MKFYVYDKIILGAIYLSIATVVIGSVGLFLGENNAFSLIIAPGTSVFVLNAGFLILRYSGFLKSKKFKYVKLAIGIIIIGSMLKIMHWPFSAQVLLLGYLAVFVSYLIYKIRHEKLDWMSWIKLIFLLIFLGGRYFSITHWPYHQELSIISVFLLGVIVFHTIRLNKLSII